MALSEAARGGRHAAVTNSSIAPRVLIITDHTRLARALEHHVSIVWSDADCRVYSPRTSGHLHSAFTAMGYDAVLLDDAVDGQQGMEWFENLLHRPGFPPIIYLASADHTDLAENMTLRGAADCLDRNKIDNRRLDAALRSAEQRRRRNIESQTTSAQAGDDARFGAVRIAGHRFVRQLAAGGSSMIYLAESERAGAMVVLKVLRESANAHDAHLQFERFLQEYEVISRIRHPNVVRIYDLGFAQDHAFIAMEYFSGGDLRAPIAQLDDPQAALALLLQITHALQVVHEVGVLHRDLKPGNIMLRADGTLALIDFGLARQLNASGETTGIGQIFGTPYYMSPEQGHGQTLDARSDLYSLGVIFYEMLVHRKPFVAPTPLGVIYQHANAPLPVLAGELQRYQSLLNRMLAKDVDDRFACAAQLAEAIESLLLPVRGVSLPTIGAPT